VSYCYLHHHHHHHHYHKLKLTVSMLITATGRSRVGPVRIQTRLWAGRPGFDSRHGQWWDLILFATASRPTQGPTQPPNQRVSEAVCDSSVGIALDYGLDFRGSRVRFPAGAGNFSLHHRVQTDTGAYPASYPMGTRGSFPGGKAAGLWSWPLTST
jgi:hypothetical protein